MDLTILLDTSADSSLYDMTRSFLQQIIEGLQFTFGNTRVAYITFDRHATLQFGLGAHKERQEFLNSITIPLRGDGTNIEGALRLMKSQVYVAEAGDRPHVPNVAIIISDGYAQRAPLVEVGDTVVYVVGLGRYVNQAILQATATRPSSSHMFLAATQDTAINMANKLLDRLCL